MTIRDEFLELLRRDPDFRDIVRRQVLTEELLASSPTRAEEGRAP